MFRREKIPQIVLHVVLRCPSTSRIHCGGEALHGYQNHPSSGRPRILPKASIRTQFRYEI